jgi:hypothetical protein
VESFKKQMVDLELLDWFNVINYCEDQKVYRYACPKVYYDHDNLVDEIRNYDFKFPYAAFSNRPSILLNSEICLWTEKDRTVESFTDSNSICVVPRDIKTHLRTQIYDYPYVNVEKRGESIRTEDCLDIIYISNGEPAAAERSDTPWFFAVFAKLEIDLNFDWSWQPDYFQEPKHYIFHARNPVNGLVYGHQAMIAYNKRLVLETVNSGLDFTLSKAHEVVPILSGIAHYDQDAWTTWRTAFREVIKLKHFSITQPSIETEFRLKKWLTVGNGHYGEWSILGAQDAIEYYDTVNGEYDKLMLSYEWAWLRQYYDTKY